MVSWATYLTQLCQETQVYHIWKLLVHQHYAAVSERNNIALLELDQPLECRGYIQLGCVPHALLKMLELKHCYITGWGIHTAKGKFPNKVQAPRAS
ncbi:hypothetical protein WISP_24328 [Willisornis vidua]|uniref:Peptidase S1 domain-containing protein n=1 Tax=Willisornis vidua TaxID=1566151 RepID=A0ABQ9DM73_9PASS|nr:hypothetical protein WISP_24328 [Willisornis vidua]